MPRTQMFLNTFKCGHKFMQPGRQTAPPAERDCPKCETANSQPKK